MPNNGPVSFDLHYDATGETQLNAVLGSATIPTWSLAMPTLVGQTHTFAAILTKLDVTGLAPNEKIIAACEMQISGDVTTT